MIEKKVILAHIQSKVRPICRQALKACLLIGIVTEHVAFAGETDTFPFVFPNHSLTSTEAATAAGRIEQECSRILALVPRLSPKEEAWLYGEIQAGRDVEGLMRRPEYMRNALFVFFSDCVSQSQLAAQGATQRDRAVGWASLASRFSSAIDLSYWGDHAGIVGLQNPVERFAAWSRINTYLILDSAVLPYMEGDARY